MNAGRGRAFDPEQLHCLAAMGIVAWVPKHEASEAAGVVAPPMPVRSTPCEAPDDVGSRALDGFERRGTRVHETGDAGARLLVLCERMPGDAPGAPPLSGDAAELFRAMLRSIDLEREDASLCALAGPETSVPGGEAPGGAPRVAGLLARDDGRRPVLHFVREHDIAGDDGHVGDRQVWRLPHPAVLLERPIMKRVAWRTLERVRATLRRHDAWTPSASSSA